MPVSVQLVAEDSGIDMIGPYLSTHADCPECGKRNKFAFMESRMSPVYTLDRCAHLRARIIDDEGINQFEFETNC